MERLQRKCSLSALDRPNHLGFL